MAEGARALSDRTNAAHAREVGKKGLDGRVLGGRFVVFHVSHYTRLRVACQEVFEVVSACGIRG